ncbi:MAG TPA: hypothetical protein VHG32_00050 [Thermoanaerobaculia bacterium]|jgi:hypothetical protein|nr:hypothetical protein [Thermoanaerobaculia bacterium]
MSEPLQPIETARSDQTDSPQIQHALGDTTILHSVPFTVRLRLEEDVANAYREWYKQQVSMDKRDELGRFLFGVSSASLGLLAGLRQLLPHKAAPVHNASYMLVVSAALLLLSAVCALYLAVPKNRQIPPDKIELVSLQRENANEITTVAIIWFGLWILGVAAAGFQLTF